MADQPQHGERLRCLDGVRGLALILILPCHCAIPQLAVAAPTWFDTIYLRLVTLGWVGLDIFFVLSGFLITGILVRSKGHPGYFKNFYMRRALRVFPLYYLIIVLLLYVLPRPERPDGMAAAHLLYYQNIWYALSPFHVRDGALEVTWSMAIEEQFYLVWPAIVWLVPRRHLAKVCVAAIVGAIALRWGLVANGFERTWLLTPCRADSICLGGLLAVTSGGPAWLWRVLLGGSVAGLLGLAFAGDLGFQPPFRFGPWLDLPVIQVVGLSCAALFAASVMMVARQGGWLGRLFSTRFMGMLGMFSYAAYLSHMLVIELLAKLLLDPPNDADAPWLRSLAEHLSVRDLMVRSGSNIGSAVFFYLLVMTCTLGIGWLSWHLIEKRFLTLKRYFPSA
jgi:peptidoglycan/LPS O-acetylase OafA/YrhL